MKVFVVFEFPEIKDVDSQDADSAIECLEIDLKTLAKQSNYSWYIDDATGETL
jgi:uncharacterized protein YsxB (DUF464 family)